MVSRDTGQVVNEEGHTGGSVSNRYSTGGFALTISCAGRWSRRAGIDFEQSYSETGDGSHCEVFP